MILNKRTIAVDRDDERSGTAGAGADDGGTRDGGPPFPSPPGAYPPADRRDYTHPTRAQALSSVSSRIGRRKKPIPTKPRLFDEEALSELGKALKEALAEL